jgi:hypothetical protein
LSIQEEGSWQTDLEEKEKAMERFEFQRMLASCHCRFFLTCTGKKIVNLPNLKKHL